MLVAIHLQKDIVSQCPIFQISIFTMYHNELNFCKFLSEAPPNAVRLLQKIKVEGEVKTVSSRTEINIQIQS